jgi:hypothetical protein
LSLFDVLEEISVLEPIAEPGEIPLTCHLVTLWRRDKLEKPTTDMVRVRVLSPSGEQARKTSTYRVDLTKHERLRHRLALNAVPIISPGALEFIVEIQVGDDSWAKVASVPLDIKVKVPTNPGS